MPTREPSIVPPFEYSAVSCRHHAFISKTAKRINIMTPKKVARKGVVAEPT